MSDALHLIITTPATVLVDCADVRSVRAEDESGGFGVMPGHTDLLTVLPASVVRWRNEEDIIHYCALRGGILRVSNGRQVAIACRQGTLSDELPELESEVEALRTAELEDERNARVEEMRLEARAVRQLVRYLRRRVSGRAEMAIPDGERS
jgi:F-type H+-transporting ATPase subunit epsilon